jgi:hypothetical protein
MMAADAMTIDFTRATTLYVNVFAQAGTATGFGLYNINAEFEPTVGPNATAVRLPASAPLLSAGLAALFWTFRRRPQAIVTGTVP